MKLSHLKLIPAAAALAMLCAAGSAQAGAYGYSYNNILLREVVLALGDGADVGARRVKRTGAAVDDAHAIQGRRAARDGGAVGYRDLARGHADLQAEDVVVKAAIDIVKKFLELMGALTGSSSISIGPKLVSSSTCGASGEVMV